MTGFEFTYMALVNGNEVFPLISAKDYSQAYEGNTGPNTGGMGGYAPAPEVTEEHLHEAREFIIKPTADAMVKEGKPLSGLLYAGLMVTPEGVKVVEFNARFGDPETQLVLPLLESDLYVVITDLLNGKQPTLTWSKSIMLGVVLASKGYPGSYETGFPIEGLSDIDSDTLVFHAGTARQNNQLISKGGRVLMLGKKAGNLYTAREELYPELGKIKCTNLFYRKDI